MNIVLSYVFSFIRIVSYIYVAFVGYDIFRHNGKDRNLEVLVVGNILMASVLCASLIFKLIEPTYVYGSEVVAVALTPVSLFWAMSHFYVYLKKHDI